MDDNAAPTEIRPITLTYEDTVRLLPEVWSQADDIPWKVGSLALGAYRLSGADATRFAGKMAGVYNSLTSKRMSRRDGNNILRQFSTTPEDAQVRAFVLSLDQDRHPNVVPVRPGEQALITFGMHATRPTTMDSALISYFPPGFYQAEAILAANRVLGRAGLAFPGPPEPGRHLASS